MATQLEIQLQKALAEAQKKLAAAKKKKKGDSGWTPPFDGAHRGY
jgi:hypothetical protein